MSHFNALNHGKSKFYCHNTLKPDILQTISHILYCDVKKRGAIYQPCGINTELKVWGNLDQPVYMIKIDASRSGTELTT